jgi:hypothetical protein
MADRTAFGQLGESLREAWIRPRASGIAPDGLVDEYPSRSGPVLKTAHN